LTEEREMTDTERRTDAQRDIAVRQLAPDDLERVIDLDARTRASCCCRASATRADA